MVHCARAGMASRNSLQYGRRSRKFHLRAICSSTLRPYFFLVKAYEMEKNKVVSRDLRDKVLKRIKKALKSNQKQLDLRAMRHLDIILAKKLVSSICPRDDFGEAKNPYISRLFRIPWVIPTRCWASYLTDFAS